LAYRALPGSSRWRVPLSRARTDESCGILRKRIEGDGEWLFPSQLYPGRPLLKVNKAHDTACAKSGVSFVIYDLRHTFATRVAPLVDPITPASIMGHANLRTIMRYVHPQAEDKRRAQELYQAAMNRRLVKVAV